MVVACSGPYGSMALSLLPTPEEIRAEVSADLHLALQEWLAGRWPRTRTIRRLHCLQCQLASYSDFLTVILRSAIQHQILQLIESFEEDDRGRGK